MKSNKELAEKWADDCLNSEAGKLAIEKINQDFIDYILFGKSTIYLNKIETENLIKLRENEK